MPIKQTLQQKQEKLKALEAELIVAKHKKDKDLIRKNQTRVRVQRYYIRNLEQE